LEGEENHRRWLDRYGVRIIHPPKRNSLKRSWPKHLRRWVASIRQIIESVYDKLFNTFGLWRERPHELEGLRARLAARVALHNFCIWLNEQLGRPRLAFADLLGWWSQNSHQAFKDAPILILDEATSSVDTQTEEDIQEALHELMQERTAIVIAHRLSTVRRADLIAVLEGGSIMELGTHEHLMRCEGLYRNLYDRQFGAAA
jgi:hypothetical protein